MDRRRILLIGAVVVAALAAVLVFVYASRSTDDTTTSAGATVPVLIATQDISAGESANKAYAEGKITVQNVPAGSVLPGAGEDGTPYKDTFAKTTIYAGEQLLPSKFGTQDQATDATQTLTPLKGDSAMAIIVPELNHVGPYIKPGSRVAMFVLPEQGKPDPQTGAVNLFPGKVLIPNVKVIGLCTTICVPDPLSTAGATAVATASDTSTSSPSPSPSASASSTVNPGGITEIILSVNQQQAETIGGALFAKNAPEVFFLLLNKDSKIVQDYNFGPNLRSPDDSQEN